MIIPVKRGEENTDYVNASFIDVSVEAPRISVVSLKVMRAGLSPPLLTIFLSARHPLAGLPSEGLLYGEPGPAAAHHRGLLEDDLGVEKLLHRHAHRAGGERAGMRMNYIYKYYLLFHNSELTEQTEYTVSELSHQVVIVGVLTAENSFKEFNNSL